jgi:protein-S-isoprenylcysteine O-methyltransferase Ste14
MHIQSIFLSVLFVLYFLSDTFLSNYYQKKYKKNQDHVYKNPSNETQRFLGQSIRLMQFIYIILLVYHLLDFDFGGMIALIEIINIPVIWISGFSLGVCFIGLSIASRLTLGSSWRVGIDKSTNDKLITKGIYKLIRNPFFASILGFQLSIILIIS